MTLSDPLRIIRPVTNGQRSRIVPSYSLAHLGCRTTPQPLEPRFGHAQVRISMTPWMGIRSIHFQRLPVVEDRFGSALLPVGNTRLHYDASQRCGHPAVRRSHPLVVSNYAVNLRASAK